MMFVINTNVISSSEVFYSRKLNSSNVKNRNRTISNYFATFYDIFHDNSVSKSSKTPKYIEIKLKRLSICSYNNHVNYSLIFLPEKWKIKRHICNDSLLNTEVSSNGGSGDKIGNNNNNGGNNDESKNNDDDDDDKEEDINQLELLSLAQAESMAAKEGVKLPIDLIEIATKTGIRSESLLKFFDLQRIFAINILVKNVPWVRDRLIADPRFLFKVGAEILIDSGCATVAEVRKRGKDFFAEIELYMSDMLVGLVMDVVLVSLLAPVAINGAKPKSAYKKGLSKYIAKLPSSVFEASIKGIRQYTVLDRGVCYLVRGIEYGACGICCGLIGQGLANSLILIRRKINDGQNENYVTVPPLVKTALVWGLFMSVSSNTRYQIVNGLERVIDMTLARRIPSIAYFTTIVIRFCNNIIGGENFIDMARWAGVQ